MRAIGFVQHALAERHTDAPRAGMTQPRAVPSSATSVSRTTSGASALGDLINRYAKHGSTVILSGVQNQPRQVLTSMGIKDGVAGVQFARDYAESLEISRRITDTAT